MQVNPIITEFVSEYIAHTLATGNKTIISRNAILSEFLDTHGSHGMSTKYLRMQVSFIMDNHYPRLMGANSRGPGGATWVIGGTLA